ncbi:HK97 family phage prohead protease [Streptomyces sp. NPDC050421]|uniref:HK97 family phage prohead protease n=1 Tax=Streptomyces sp. NPDC050421 TaxID=3365613 RepID=UPI003790B15B
MTESRELRFASAPLEQRSSDDGRISMRGYAYRFNELSHDLGGFRERIVPGAGAPSLTKNDVYATFNHDTRSLLGRVSSGTLRVGEDRDGGWYEVDLPDTTVGRDVAELLKRGDLQGSSFTFRVNDGGQRRADADDDETGLPVREITGMDVLEVGPVVNPAYPTTDARLKRSIDECLGLLAPDVEPVTVPVPPVVLTNPDHNTTRALIGARSERGAL